MQWTELENYRQLLQDYERRSAQYGKLLKTYRDAQEAGKGDTHEVQQMKETLDKEQPELETLYNQLRGIRNELAHARDSALAQ